MARANPRPRITRLSLSRWLLLSAVFLLPWQTRWIVGASASEFLTLSVYATEVVIIAAFLLGRYWQPTVNTQKLYEGLMLLLAGVLIVSTFSGAYLVSLFFLFHLMVAAMFCVMLWRLTDQHRQLIAAFVLGLVSVALLGWYQVVHGVSPASTLFGLAAKDAAIAGVSVVEIAGDRLLRAYGSFPHPNIFGGFLAAAVLMLSASLMKQDSWWKAVCLSFLSATLVITFSRSAWIAVIAGLIALCWFKRDMIKQHVWRNSAVLLLVIVSAAVPVWVFSDQVHERLVPTERIEVASISERAGQYEAFGDVVGSNLLFGVGPGAYTAELAKLTPGQPVWTYQPIHNTFLLVLAEIGVVGVVLFLLAFQKLKHYWSTKLVLPLLLLLPILLVDHYLWSSWSGLTMVVICVTLVLRTLDNTSGGRDESVGGT